jgi:demethylmenaquinone methyltransferase/2-methoxy-6-polyprenyl-1,4-benzoquinol methylase
MNRDPDEYRSIAPVYDPLLSPFLQGVRSRVVDIALNFGLRTVIDLCCGTGEQCWMLRQKGVRAFGIDLSPAMLRKAASGHPAGGYVLGDATALPFHPGISDGAILSFALHEKSPAQQQDILNQARNILVPDGVLVVIDFCRPAKLLAYPALFMIMAVERLAGAKHFANFRQYMNRGGLQGLLQLNPGLEAIARHPFFMTTVNLVLVRVSPARGLAFTHT